MKSLPFIIIVLGTLLLCACEKKSAPTLAATENSLFTSDAIIQNLRVTNPRFLTALSHPTQHIIAGTDGTIISLQVNSANAVGGNSLTTGVSNSIFALATNSDASQWVAVGEEGLLLHSTDGGAHWIKKISHSDKKLLAIAFDTAHNTWVAGGEQGALLYSSNGADWRTIALENNANISAIYAVPTRASLIALGDNGLLLFSTNGGSEWQTIAVDAELSLARLVVYGEVLLLATTDGKILRSDSHWQHWETIATGSNAFLTGLHHQADTDTLIAISSAGEILLSDDGGTLWAPVAMLDAPLNTISTFNQTLWVTGDSGTLAYSHNGGRTWSPIKTGTEADIEGLIAVADGQLVAYGAGGLLLHSKNQGQDWQWLKAPALDFVHQLSQTPAGLWLAVGAKGLLLSSTNGGQDWQAVNATTQQSDYFFSMIHDQQSNRLIAAGPPGTVVVSDDGGDHWRVRLALGDATQGYFHQLLGNDEGTLVAIAGPGKIHYSTDAGEHWEGVESDDNRQLFSGTYSHPLKRFIAVGQGGRITLSADGKHWQAQESGVSHSLQMTYADGKRLWVGGEQGILLYSDNAGKQWHQIATHTNRTLLSLTKLQSGTLIITGTHGTLLRSTNAGQDWQLQATPATDLIRQPVQDPATGILYASSRAGTIIYSRDDGQHWQPLDKFTSASIKSLALDTQQRMLLGGGERLIRIPLLH